MPVVSKLVFKNREEFKKRIALEGLTLKEFSKETNIGYSNLSQYLNNKKNPSTKNAKKLADFFGKDIKDIFF